MKYIVVAPTVGLALDYVVQNLVLDHQISKVLRNRVETNDGRFYDLVSAEQVPNMRGFRYVKAYLHEGVSHIKQLAQSLTVYSPEIGDERVLSFK